MAGHPNYHECQKLTLQDVKSMKRGEILNSYTILRGSFEFPPDTKYPSIPCYVDENCTIFPLSGDCVLTGAEYILALNQGCKFNFTEIYYIPFRKIDKDQTLKPFENVIKIVQENRREFPKGTISNLMYKEIGNSIYGSVVRGISNKKKFDTKTKTTQRMGGDELSNPLIAS